MEALPYLRMKFVAAPFFNVDADGGLEGSDAAQNATYFFQFISARTSTPPVLTNICRDRACRTCNLNIAEGGVVKLHW